MGGFTVKVELFAILKDEASSQSVALQRMVEGVFTSMSDAQVNPFRIFNETKNYFGEMEKAFSRASVIVAAADEKAFLEQKWNLLKALGLKAEICPAVQNVMRESATVPDASMKAHALMPKDGALFLSPDGLYSGFAVRSGKQTLLFIPLSEERTEGVMGGVRQYFEARAKKEAAQAPKQPVPAAPIDLPDNNLRFAETAMLLAENDMAVAFARTETSVYLLNGMRNNPSCGDSFVPTEAVADSRESVTERMACLAETARREIGTKLGAAISNIYSLGSDNGMFINVALADSGTAHVRKISCGSEMAAADLVVLATDELFTMVQSYVQGDEFPPEDVELIPAKLFADTPEQLQANQKKKRGTALKIMLCVLIAIILCVLIGFYFKDEVSAMFFDTEPTTIAQMTTETASEPPTTQETTEGAEESTEAQEDFALFGMAQPVAADEKPAVQQMVYETPVPIDWDVAVQPYIEKTTESATTAKETTTKETTAKATTTKATTTTTKKAETTTSQSTTEESSTGNPFSSTTATTTTTKPTTASTTEKFTLPIFNFDTSTADGTFTFTVYGYGHGVGMSQMGALAYAQQGWSYAQILAHYYPGTTLSRETAPATVKYNGKELDTKEFMIRVVQQEIGGYAKSADLEALKAQAVAAYSYMKAKGYNLTSNDMAYSTIGDSQLSSVVKSAVESTLGEYLSYNGKAILAQFYASSAGKTTSAENVWGGKNYPYLVSGVESPEQVSKTTVTISAADFKTIIQKYNAAHPSNPITLSGDPSGWLQILSHDGARGDVGYISSIRVGDKTMNGNAFRTMFNAYRPSGVNGIRSHCFALAVS